MSEQVLSLVYATNRTRGPVGKIVIREIDGKGTVILEKLIKSKHMLRQPPAICFDRPIIELAQSYSVETIQVKNTENGSIYTIPFEQFLDKSFRVNRGFGEQLGCCLSEWDSTYSLKKSPKNYGVTKCQTPQLPSVTQPGLFVR